MSDAPLISIVTGTFQRLASLMRFVESVRSAFPQSIPHEIILVDGGSTDGTLQWSKAQPHIRLIEHGELRGAIRAFCDGAAAARGKYVVLANDDIAFVPGSILRALVHLETTPRCGGVAFEDNRPIPSQRPEERHLFKVQFEPALAPDGTPTNVVYAQVGMFRKWLGDALGWWGADDPVMSEARTYGGDNWLSSRVWESGYTIDTVRGAQVRDFVVDDGLRLKNVNNHDRAYAKAYPRGPRIGSRPIPLRATDERMRVLYLPIYEPDYPIHKETKRGLREALAKRCIVLEWDYLSSAILADEVAAFRPHLILTQFHDSRWSKLIEQLRFLCPQALIVNWNGDARGLTEAPYLEMLRLVDLQLVVNAAALDVYKQAGIPAAYWQIGLEEPDRPLPDVPRHDVVFLANCYNEARRELEAALMRSGLNVGLYGFGWQRAAGHCQYDFATGAALYKNARIALSDSFIDHQTPTRAFVSNRFIQALGAGAFLLQQHCADLEMYTGFRAGTHYVEWKGLRDLMDMLHLFLSRDDERRQIAQAGQRFVYERYTFDALVRQLFAEILPRLEARREPA